MTALENSLRYASAPNDRLHARDLVVRYGWHSIAYQILNPGMRYWFSPAGDAVVGYVVAGGYWVAAGSPICAPERLNATAGMFAVAAARQGYRVCYFGAQDGFAAALVPNGPVARLLLGAQPVWNPHHWLLILAHKASLRAQIARARNKRVLIQPWTQELAAHHPALRQCLAAWLATRGLPPLHFLVEPAMLAALDDRRIFVARRADAVVAYLIATPIPRRNGWLIEQIVRDHGAPNGTAELLIDTAMRTLAAVGATYVTLGLSPLSTHTDSSVTPQSRLIQTLLAWARAHGNRFYNFAGLDAFKTKLQPEHWEPIYALSYERQPSLRTLYAIAGAFSGTSPLIFLPRTMLRAVRQEMRWMIE